MGESPSLDHFEPVRATGGGMWDRRHDMGIRAHLAFGSSVGNGSWGHCSGFGGSLRAVGDTGAREVVGTGVSVAGMFSLGAFDDGCCHQYCLQIASTCLLGCISMSVDFVRICHDQLRSGFGFDSVSGDGQDEIGFVS